MPEIVIPAKGYKYVGYHGFGVTEQDRWNNYTGTLGQAAGAAGAGYPMKTTFSYDYCSFVEFPSFGPEWNYRTINNIKMRVQMLFHGATNPVARPEYRAHMSWFIPQNINPNDWNGVPRTPQRSDFEGENYNTLAAQLCTNQFPYADYHDLPSEIWFQDTPYQTPPYEGHGAGVEIEATDMTKMLNRVNLMKDGTIDSAYGFMFGTIHGDIGLNYMVYGDIEMFLDYTQLEIPDIPPEYIAEDPLLPKNKFNLNFKIKTIYGTSEGEING